MTWPDKLKTPEEYTELSELFIEKTESQKNIGEFTRSLINAQIANTYTQLAIASAIQQKGI